MSVNLFTSQPQINRKGNTGGCMCRQRKSERNNFDTVWLRLKFQNLKIGNLDQDYCENLLQSDYQWCFYYWMLEIHKNCINFLLNSFFKLLFTVNLNCVSYHYFSYIYDNLNKHTKNANNFTLQLSCCHFECKYS